MDKVAKVLFLTLALMLAVGLALPQAAPPASADNSVEIQLGMILDGSGSISDSEWGIMLDGLAAAIEGPNFPKDGTVELTIVQFAGTRAQLEIGPLVIDSPGNATAVADKIRSIIQLKGATPLACGIYMLSDVLHGLRMPRNSPTANSANFTDPDEAHDDGGGYATATIGEVEQYYNYDFSIPTGATIYGIEVRLDAWQSGRNGHIAVELSWDGGGNWTTTGYDTGVLSSSGERTYYLGGPTDDWGRTWTPDEINDHFRVRLIIEDATDLVYLDWVPVFVYHQIEDEFDPNLVQSINIVTDGEANRCCDDYTGGYSCSTTEARTSAVAARNYLISELQMNWEEDRVNAEGVGIQQPQIDWLRDSIVWPQQGEEAPPYPDQFGWVRAVGNWTELADAFQQKIEIATLELDFGDAPDPTYPTYLDSNGARHVIPSDESIRIWMGPTIDSENDGQPPDLDDTTGVDDEDGVEILGADLGGGVYAGYFLPGQQGEVEITVSGNVTDAYLHGWIDWNQDGVWGDAGENVFCSEHIGATGNFTFDFPVPGNATLGLTWARFRLDDDNELNSP